MKTAPAAPARNSHSGFSRFLPKRCSGNRTASQSVGRDEGKEDARNGHRNGSRPDAAKSARAAPGIGAARPDRGAGGRRARDCLGVPGFSRRDESAESLGGGAAAAGSDRLGQDADRRGGRRGPVRRHAGAGASGLRRVSAQPRNCQADRVAAGLPGAPRNASGTDAGGAQPVAPGGLAALAGAL